MNFGETNSVYSTVLLLLQGNSPRLAYGMAMTFVSPLAFSQSGEQILL